jgi:hypothetical protein
MEDGDGKSLAVAASLAESRVILIGHNFVTNPKDYMRDPNLKLFTVSLLNWLLS